MAKDYRNDFRAFFTDLYRVEGAYGPSPLMPPFLGEFLGHAFKDGVPIARNILDARSKKEGKSALAGAVGLFMASKYPYSEVYIIAADKDQAADRVLRAIKYACHNGPLESHTKVYKDIIELDNQSIIKALPGDWQGAAGGNPVCVIVDEMHAWVYENQRRLFDEMVIPPTQAEGVRWIASYAGFLGESELLKDWWDRGLKGEKISETLPIYHNDNAGLLAFIDTGPDSWRMPWLTEKYISEIRHSERDSTFRRLWLNEWIANESAFVPMEAWDACYSGDVRPLVDGDNRKIILGIDASTTRDITALVGTWYNPEVSKSDVIYIRAFKPKRGLLRFGKPTIDLELVRDEVLRLHNAGLLAYAKYDPFQLHSVAIELERSGVRMVEFPQTNLRIEADQQLYDAIISGTLRHYNDPNLNQHIRNAVAIESPRGFRLAKEKTSLKIDLAVALSMSLYGAVKSQYQTGVEVVPNPFYAELAENETFYYSNSGGFVVDSGAPKKHAPGVNWQNCRYTACGCPACIEELAQEGFYEKQKEERKLLREAHPELDYPMPLTEAGKIKVMSYGHDLPPDNRQQRATCVTKSLFDRDDCN